MKILQVIPTLSSGGAEGFVTNLAVRHAELGNDVRFFLLAGVRGRRGQMLLARLQNANISVVGVEEHNIRSPLNLLRLVQLIRSWKPDIVQANLYSCEVACAAARLLSLGSGACFVRRLPSSKCCNGQTSWVGWGLDHSFHLTIACSPAVAVAFRGIRKSCETKPLVTIANGGELLEAVPSYEEKIKARHSLGLSENSFVVAHIGRMWGMGPGTGLKTEPKAQDILLEAFARAFQGNRECNLILVGDGPLRPEAEVLTQSLGISEQVRFLGEQPEPWPALTAANLFCFPSRYEGLANVLPEAASCGLPVVASDIPENRYLCPGNAWLLEPVDNIDRFAHAMRAVYTETAEYNRRAFDAAHGFRERFSMIKCAKEYLHAYELAICSKQGVNSFDNVSEL